MFVLFLVEKSHSVINCLFEWLLACVSAGSKKHSFSTLLRLVIDHRNLVVPGVVEVGESESGYKLGVKSQKNMFSIYAYFQSLMIGTWLNLGYSGSRGLNLSKKSRLKVEWTSAKRSTEIYGILKRSVLGYRLWRIRIYLWMFKIFNTVFSTKKWIF